MPRFVLLFIAIDTPAVHQRLVLNHDFSLSACLHMELKKFLSFFAYVTPRVPHGVLQKCQQIWCSRLGSYSKHIHIYINEDFYYKE